MRLTLYTDYALRTLIYLALRDDTNVTDGKILVSVNEIARLYQISQNHLVKVIHHLGRAGFIETLRGRKGGLRLARPAKEICIGDVVRSTEEDMALVACMQGEEGHSDCLLSGGCRLKSVLYKARHAFMAELDAVNLSDIVTDYECRILLSKAG